MVPKEDGWDRTATFCRAIAVIVLFLSGAACDRSRAPDASNRRTMIAVLPFENLGPPGDAYFADGITEEIRGRLGAAPELGVISRTSARQHKGTDKSIKEIARELGVSRRWSTR